MHPFCRGEERAEMLAPWKKTLSILGLGTTIGTSVSNFVLHILFDFIDSQLTN